MCPPNFTFAVVTLGIPMLLFLYKVCDRSWVSWNNALITQCFQMPGPWENTVFKRMGKTRLRTRFSCCYNQCSQFFCPCLWLFCSKKSCSFNYVVCHLYIMDTISGLFTIDAWANSDLIFLELYCQSSFFAQDRESIAVWCMYLDSWITSIWFNFDVSKSRANWSMKRTVGKWSRHQFPLVKTHK